MPTGGHNKKENSRNRNQKKEYELFNSNQKLDTGLPIDNKYLPATLTWYNSWLNSPLFKGGYLQQTDINRLRFMVAPLVDSYIRNPKHFILSEIRYNESLIGGTLYDRKRLGFVLKDVKDDKELDMKYDTKAKDINDRLC